MIYAHMTVLGATVLAVVLLTIPLVNCQYGQKLAPIWEDEEPDFNMVAGAYHSLSELHLVEIGKSFLIEEWALGRELSFRMDLTDLETSRRSTLLIDGKKRANYYYEPFKCKNFVDLNGVLPKDLANKFPGPQGFVVAGIGSIWLNSMKLDQSFTPASTKGPSELSKPEDNKKDPKKYSRKSASSILKMFGLLQVQATDKYPFRVKFFFHDNVALAADATSMQPGLLTIAHLVSDNGELPNVVARFRLIKFETSDQAAAIIKTREGLFELPLGYGCSRVDGKRSTSDPEYVAPANCFIDEPHVFEMDVVSLRPTQFEQDIDKWKSHSSSLRFVSGTFGSSQESLQQYLVIEQQEHASNFGSDLLNKAVPWEKKLGQAHLGRKKRIWDLGNSREITTNLSLRYFDIDEQNAKCLGFGQGDLDQLPGVYFPIVLFDLDDGTGKDHGQSIETAGITLSDIQDIFIKTEGYYFLRETQNNWSKFKEIIYERREDSFQLVNPMGEPIHSGPASIVRHFYLSNKNVVTNQQDSANESRVRVTIHLYTKSLDKLLTRIHLNLSPGRLVDAAYLHRELNLGPCLNLFSYPMNGQNHGIAFAINYPVDSKDALAALPVEGHLEEEVYEKFLNSLRVATSNAIDLLQLVDIKVKHEMQVVRVSGKVVNWPHLFSYEIRPRMRLGVSNARSTFKELRSNEADCAETCVHYNCAKFTYCSNTSRCDILLGTVDGAIKNSGHNRNMDFIVYEPDEDCNTFVTRADQSGDRNRPSPIQFVHMIQETILKSVEDEQGQNGPLAFEVELGDSLGSDEEKAPEAARGKLVLVPSLIETSVPMEDEIAADLVASARNDKGRLNLGQRSIRPEYELIFVGNRYKKPRETNEQFPLTEANHLVYEDCESLCEELDCRSFSYCQIEKSCQISRLHEVDSIAWHVEPSEICNVFVRDYWSNFYVSATSIARPKDGQDKQANLVALRVGSGRECANHCIDHESFKCRSFYYCIGPSSNCYLQASRAPVSETSTKQLANRTSSNEFEGECQLYSRSYLMEFDRFYGKRLPDSSDKFEIVLFQGIGAENCATECIEYGQTCHAFHVCQDTGLHQPICAIISYSSGSNQIEPSECVTAVGCTAFLSTNLTSQWILPINTLDDPSDPVVGPTSTGGNEMSQLSIWVTRLIVVLLGVAIGFTVTFVAATWRNSTGSGQRRYLGETP